MAGIVSYGAYVPLFRLGKGTVGWEGSSERAVANFDEDSMTMAVAALRDALTAPTVAWPLGLYDCCGVSDGAAVAIITRPEIAKKMRDDYVMVKGIGFAVSGRQELLQDDYDFVHFEESVRAAKMAYAHAGITNPAKRSALPKCMTASRLLSY